MIEWIQQFLDGINSLPVGYVAAFFALSGMLQAVIPIYPGDILLIIGAGIWTGGLANDFFPVLFSYWAGTTAASLGITELGRNFEAYLLSRRILRKVFSEERKKKVSVWIRKLGAFTVFAAKFIFGMNLPVLLLSGVLKMPRKHLYPAVIVTTIVHNCLFYTLGSVVGLNWQNVGGFLREYQMALAFFLALALGVGFWLRDKLTGRNKPK